MVKRKVNPRNRKPASHKGQAVMEYLITYGLALFVILVVLGILFAVILPMLKAPQSCQFTDPTFSCNQKQASLVADSNNNVRMLFQLDNTGSTPVVIEDVLCTTLQTGNVKASDFKNILQTAGNQSLGSGQSLTFGSSASGVAVTVPCTKEDGSRVVLTPNSDFKGTLAILYANAEEVPGTPPRIAVATLTGTVQAG